MPTITHPVVVLNAPDSIPDFIVHINGVIAAIEADPIHFPNPDPPLAKVKADNQALEAWQTKVETKIPGAVEGRRAAKHVVDIDAKGLVAYVQSRVNADLPNAAILAAAANLALKGVGVAKLADLVVELGTEPGTASLEAHNFEKSTKTMLHEWRWTPDGWKTTVDARSTSVAHTTIKGLPHLTNVGFQHRVCWDGHDGEWSATVTILVP
jgi:hypothetical protein